MTGKEAVEILDRDDSSMRKGYFCINDFLAIEKLKEIARQEPCEDAISRKAVLDEISKSVDHSLWAYKSLIECVKDLPPITSQQKIGRWIKSDIGGAKVCSVCQAHMGLSNFKYCPNCGVKMEIEGKDGVYCKNCVDELRVQDVVKRRKGTPRENYKPLYNCENWIP